MGEIELNVLNDQCLNRRIDAIEVVRRESLAWQEFRNNKGAKVKWQIKEYFYIIFIIKISKIIDNVIYQ